MQIGFILWLLRRLCNACQAKFARMNIMKKEKLPFENCLLKIIIEIIYHFYTMEILYLSSILCLKFTLFLHYKRKYRHTIHSSFLHVPAQ